MKLFIYDHCPFCVKAHMIFGLTNTPVELIYLMNDDEATPISLIGKKMVPILEKPDGGYMPESMDIVQFIDQLTGYVTFTEAPYSAISALLTELSQYSFKLISPRNPFVGFAEFKTQSAQDYFINKKTEMIGDFAAHREKSAEYLSQINAILHHFSSEHATFFARKGLSADDIHLFAALRCLTIVKGVEFPQPFIDYMQTISKRSNVNLLFDIAI